MHKVTEILLNEVGYLEKSKAAYLAHPEILYNKTTGAGSDNYTKYGKEMHDVYPQVMDFPAAWCDCFVDWGFYTSYGTANAKALLGGNFDDYTKNSIQLYKGKGAFFLRGSKTPQEGDQIFFSKDNTFGGVYHTGLVYEVKDGYVHTVEGNTSNATTDVVPNGGAVCTKKYPIDNKYIYGYGRPNYAPYENLEGWVQTNNDWYYYRNGAKVKREWIVYKNRRYRVGIDGKMLTDWHQIYDDDGKLQWYYFDSNGAQWCGSGRPDGSLEEMIIT